MRYNLDFGREADGELIVFSLGRALLMYDKSTSRRLVQSLDPPSHRKAHKRSFSLSLHDRDLSDSLQELDKAIESMKTPSIYCHDFEDEGSSFTLTTDFGHSVLTNRILKSNHEKGHHRRSRSVSSQVSTSSSRSKGSLKSMIERTIRQNAAQCEEACSSSVEVDDILRDLRQADAVLENEVQRSLGNLLPPMSYEVEDDELLPPVTKASKFSCDEGRSESWFDDTWKPDWSRVSYDDSLKQDPNSFSTLETEPPTTNSSRESDEATPFPRNRDTSINARDPFAIVEFHDTSHMKT